MCIIDPRSLWEASPVDDIPLDEMSTVEIQFDKWRWSRAAGFLSDEDSFLLDQNSPGWYDEWVNPDPFSEAGFKLRLALAEGQACDLGEVLIHPDGCPMMTIYDVETGVSIDFSLSGTEAEMRDQACKVGGAFLEKFDEYKKARSEWTHARF